MLRGDSRDDTNVSSEGTAGMNTSVCSEGFSSLSGFFCFFSSSSFFFFLEGGGGVFSGISVLLLNCLFCFVTCRVSLLLWGGRGVCSIPTF